MDKQSNKKKPWLGKLEKIIFYSVILFLPSQLGKHFWPPFSLVEGIRIDYLSPTLYITDILVIFLFVTFISRLMINRKAKISNFSRFAGQFPISNQFKNARILLIGLLVVSVLIGSILSSQSPMAGLYKLIKLVEFAFFGFYIAATIHWRKDFSTIAMLLAVGIFFEAFLAAAQFIKQASLGGIFWFFGERTFSGQTPGIANASMDGRLVLRPYGTFPHPNVLAGYLTIALAMVISNFPSGRASGRGQFPISNFKKISFAAALLVGTIAIFLTLSRIGILLWFVVLGLWLIAYLRLKWRMTHDKLKIYLLVVLVFIGSIGIIFYTPLPSRFTSLLTVDKESLLARQELNKVAVEMFKASPLSGVGLNNFLVRVPDYQKLTSGPLWLQPVHNVFLLILAETGLPGLLLAIWSIGKTFSRLHKKKEFPILFVVLVLGFFDHYLLTLQQGQLLLAFVLGLSWSKNS